MDHLLIPEGATHIPVPYKCTEPYDGDDFMTYPFRKGWTVEQLKGADDYGDRSPASVEAFFQTWLFFGFLTEVFKIAGFQISQDDFVDSERGVVTTKKLPALFLEWKETWRPIPTPSKDCSCKSYLEPERVDCHARRCWKTFKMGVFSEECQAINKIVETVCHIMSHYGYSHGISAKPRALKESTMVKPPMALEIVISIVALGHAIREAIHDIYDVNPTFRANQWDGTTLLRELLKEKWCPRQVTSMMKEFGVDGHYYLALSPGLPPAERARHNPCTEAACLAPGIDESTYVSKHAATGCTCEHIHMPNEACDIIRNGGIPILTVVDTGGGKYQLVAQEHNVKLGKKPEFIAISHVWSDGMGNPKTSSLPGCLISSIQQKVNDVQYPGHTPGNSVGFWMDTLCIPVQEDLRELRKLCIANMRHIYSAATAVLVLETSIETMSAEAPVLERSLRIYTTKWLSRLWTYQEGALAQKLYFQFEGKSQELDEITAGIQQQHDHSVSQGRFLPFMVRANTMASSHFNFLNFIVQTEIDEGTVDEIGWMAFIPIAASYATRQTSRRTDETICAFTVLGFDVMPILAIKEDKEKGISSEDVADIRMQMLLIQVRKFDCSIIFNSRPRLQQEGFRWAPRSLIGGIDGSWGNSSGTDVELPESVLVRWGPRLSKVGLEVKGLPGLTITSIPVHFTTNNTKRFYLEPSSSFYYDVILVPDEKGGYPIWDAEASYCLVLAHQLKNVRECIAVLGRKIAPGPKLYHECLAWVELKQKETMNMMESVPVIPYKPERKRKTRENIWVIV